MLDINKIESIWLYLPNNTIETFSENALEGIVGAFKEDGSWSASWIGLLNNNGLVEKTIYTSHVISMKVIYKGEWK